MKRGSQGDGGIKRGGGGLEDKGENSLNPFEHFTHILKFPQTL